jgi:hypothetical protein
MSKTSVFCISKSRTHAERIVERLYASGFPYSEIFRPHAGDRDRS